MMFTRRHYEAIAAALAVEGLEASRTNSGEFVHRRVIHALADLFEADNPRFKRRRFLEAAGALREERQAA